jgi:hypothetical protein
VAPRQQERIKRRFCCEILDGAERHDGVVLNFAANGLFIQTKATIPAGRRVEIQIPAANDVPEMILRAIAVRQCLLRNQTSGLVPDGLGFQILHAPDAYYELIEREQTPQDKADTPIHLWQQIFRVRAVEKAGSAYRILTVIGSSAEAAREETESSLGPDWEVTDVSSD